MITYSMQVDTPYRREWWGESGNRESEKLGYAFMLEMEGVKAEDAIDGKPFVTVELTVEGHEFAANLTIQQALGLSLLLRHAVNNALEKEAR